MRVLFVFMRIMRCRQESHVLCTRRHVFWMWYDTRYGDILRYYVTVYGLLSSGNDDGNASFACNSFSCTGRRPQGRPLGQVHVCFVRFACFFAPFPNLYQACMYDIHVAIARPEVSSLNERSFLVVDVRIFFFLYQ